jgi:hypothetical protein
MNVQHDVPLCAPARSRAPLAALVLLGAVAAGCPETIGQLCPTGTKQEGTFTTTITARNDGHDCRVVRTADAGSADASLFISSQTFDAALCSSTQDDGGQVLWFALPARLRASPLGDGGTFAFSTPDTTFDIPACNSPLVVAERIEGALIPTDADASVVIGPNGLPSLKGFTGVVYDRADAGASYDGGAYFCNTPCTTTYDMTGTK